MKAPGYFRKIQVGGNIIITRWWQLKDFLFSSRTLGEMIQVDEHIFHGWFNHQLVKSMVEF